MISEMFYALKENSMRELEKFLLCTNIAQN